MFDALTGTSTAFDTQEIEKSDAIELFRKRREDACKLWATIPDERFHLSSWASSCGTTCCAIGWLGELQHDGWEMMKIDDDDIKYPNYSASGFSPVVGYINDTLQKTIPKYFGLPEGRAGLIFGYSDSVKTCELYKKTCFSNIKLSDVSRELMAAPYEI